MSTRVQPTAGRMADARERIRAMGSPRPMRLCPGVILYQVDAAAERWHGCEGGLHGLGAGYPFWASVWPGGEAMARFLLDNPKWVRGRRVYELGTGSGAGAIAAARAGAAQVRAVDVDPVAVAAALLNAELNQVAVEAWAADPLADPPPDDVDLILAADLWFERWLARRVTPWLRRAASAGIEVLGADPGRAHLPRGGLVPLASYSLATSPETEPATRTDARVFQVCADPGS